MKRKDEGNVANEAIFAVERELHFCCIIEQNIVELTNAFV